MTYPESVIIDQTIEINENNHVKEIQKFKEEILSRIESVFGIKPDLQDKRISETAKQI
jgi:hypothetical protein